VFDLQQDGLTDFSYYSLHGSLEKRERIACGHIMYLSS